MEKLSLVVLSTRLGYISFRVLILPLEVGTITVLTRHMISASPRQVSEYTGAGHVMNLVYFGHEGQADSCGVQGKVC
jgi:hypothetical protein